MWPRGTRPGDETKMTTINARPELVNFATNAPEAILRTYLDTCNADHRAGRQTPQQLEDLRYVLVTAYNRGIKLYNDEVTKTLGIGQPFVPNVIR